MDDYGQLELTRETVFKDAVLNAAQNLGAKIIADAKNAGEAELNEARQAGEAASHGHVLARLNSEAERAQSAALLKARKTLLQAREELVDGLFAEVEQKLHAFAQSKDYPAWLAGKIWRHAAGLKQTQGAVVVFVRQADRAFEAEIAEALPGCRVETDGEIRIGGAKVSDGRVLYDETLDTALAAEKANFYHSSGLTV